MVAGLELVCVRHGTTKLNSAKIFQGQSNDPPLSDLGQAEVAHLAQRLASERYDYAVSSDLVRATQTASAILGERHAALTIDRDWREFDFGAWEGLTWEDISARYPAEATAFGRSITEVAPPGGEDFGAVSVRVERALGRIVNALPQGGRALIVTHTGPLHALRHVLLGKAPGEQLRVRFSPASITRYRLEGERVEVLAVDDIAHIPEDPE